jgi:hypothetical protein
MKSDRIVSSKRISDYIINVIEANIYKRLLDYCKRRLVEVGLTTLALVGEPDMVSNVPLARKNLARIKTLILKYLVKRIPYLALAPGEFLRMSSRDSVEIYIQTPEMTSDFKYIDWETVVGTTGVRKGGFHNYWLKGANDAYKDIALRSHPSLKWIGRYCKYMNYLSRKHGAPFSFHPTFNLHFDEKTSEEMYYDSEMSRKNKLIPFVAKVTIKISFVAWMSHHPEQLEPILSGEVDNDAFFTTEDWHAQNIIGYKHNENAKTHRYSAQKIFLHLDKALKSLSTISRKVYYETSAYSFRSNSDS